MVKDHLTVLYLNWNLNKKHWVYNLTERHSKTVNTSQPSEKKITELKVTQVVFYNSLQTINTRHKGHNKSVFRNLHGFCLGEKLSQQLLHLCEHHELTRDSSEPPEGCVRKRGAQEALRASPHSSSWMNFYRCVCPAHEFREESNAVQ